MVYLHSSISDGSSELNASDTVRLSWWKLLQEGLGFSADDIAKLEEESFPEDDALQPPYLTSRAMPPRSPQHAVRPFHSSASPAAGYHCCGHLHSSPDLQRLNAPLYIATDGDSPSLNPLLWRFIRTFPCTFFLNDFSEETRPLKERRSGMDGVPLELFLAFCVNAMVVGQIWYVVNMFSTFVTDVLWRRHHGLPIV